MGSSTCTEVRREGLQVRVGGALFGDGGCGAVAGIDGGVAGESHKAVGDTPDELRVAAALEVGAADAAVKEGVAGEEDAVRAVVVGHSARRVSGDMDGGESMRADTDGVAVGDSAGEVYGVKLHTHHEALRLTVEPLAERRVGGTSDDRDIISRGGLVDAENMVEVHVCQHYGLDTYIVVAYDGVDVVLLFVEQHAGVYDDAVAGVAVPDDVGIYAEEVYLYFFDFKHIGTYIRYLVSKYGSLKYSDSGMSITE